jgi:hypothetical protein
MVIWNATINSIQYVNTINTDLSDVHATFEVIFTKANNANPVVLAWGGHIASAQTWGEGLSAHDIPGSPYHMFVETVETAVGNNTICNGNMDCQLSSNAVSVLPTCSISGPVVACPETNLLTYTATLDAATFGAVNYTWLLTNGTPSAGAQLSGTLTGSTTAASMTRNAVPIASDFVAGGNFRLQLTVERDGNSAVCYLNSSSAPGDSVLINDVATTAAASPTSLSLNTSSISNLSATTQLNGVTDNAAFNYSWAVTSAGGLNGGSLTGASTRTPQFTAVNPGTYVFRVTATQIAAPNCVDIDSVTVVVTPAQACPTVPTAAVCADTSSVTYTASAPPSTDVSYIWSVNNGAVITSSNGLQSVTVNPGTISFTLTLVLDYANPALINDTCTYLVTVNPLPIVNTGTYGPYCIDASPVTLSGTPSGGTWSGTGVTGSTFNVQTAGVGTHQIIYNYTDANGCSAADTTSIVVNPLPVVNTGTYGPYCIDASPVTLSGTPSGGTWSGTGVTGSTFNVQTAGVGTHQIIYNYTDANGCSAADTTSIVVNPLPVVNTGSYGPVCITASPISLSGTPSGGTWSGAGVTGSTFNVQTAGVGTHQIIYNYTDANGCSAADTTSIVVNPLPVVNTGTYGPYCIDASPVTLSGTPSGGSWSGTGVTGSTFNVQTAGVGTHQIIYNYTDANGCSAADTTSIVVNPLPVVNTGTYGPVCITASPISLSGTPSGGTWSGAGVTGSTFNVQTAGVGTHPVIYNYTDANGCSAADTTSIVVNPLPIVNTGTYGPVCITASPISLSGTPSGGTWSGTGVTGSTFNVQTAGVGTHPVIYNYTDANGCSAADTTSIVVNPLPIVNTGTYGPVCITASPISLSGTPSGGTWSGTGVTGSTFNVQTAGVGTHPVIYNYTDANGCSAADTTSILVNPLPIVDAGRYDTVCDYDSTVALIGTPRGGIWIGPGVVDSTFNVQIAGVGTHQLIYSYTDANGCSASDTTEIVVEVCLDDDFCTYTQGYFGSKNGKACDGDSLYRNPVSLIRALLLPGNIVLGAGGRTITVTVNDSVRVNTVMPGGSTPRALTHMGNISMSQLGAYNYLNRQGRLNNVFLSQTLALSLNLRINPTLLHFMLDSGYLVTQKLATCGDTTTTLSCEMDSSAIQSWKMDEKVVGYLAANGGTTVENLLILANKLLGQVLMPGAMGLGGTYVPSYSSVSGMVSTINEAFDECRVFLMYDSIKTECPEEEESTQRYVDVPSEPVQTTIRASAFPNPYGKLIQFSLTGAVDGQAELSLFDLNGNQLAMLYQGIWKAGEWRLINYAVKPGQSVPMIYRFRIGKQTVTGKLMPGN